MFSFFKSIFKPVDMTTGNPLKKIVLFAIPLLLGNFAQQLYNTVDTIVVGQYIGDHALAAVGSAGSIINLMIVLFVGIAIGVSVLVSQYFGSKDADNLSLLVGNTFVLVLISSLIIALIGIFTIRPLLELLSTPEFLMDMSETYLQVFLVGGLGFAYFNILSGVLRGLGDSTSPLLYLCIASIINIILDIYFISELNMGIAGVALATVIAQWISAILCMLKLKKTNHLFVLKLEHFKLSLKVIKDIAKIGLPSGFTQCIFSIAMLFTQSLTNSFGDFYMSASVIIFRIDSFAIMPIFSLANAMTTFTGQNFGAKQYKRLFDGVKKGTFLAIAVNIFLTALLVIFAKDIMVLLTDTKELIDISYLYMLVICAGYPFFTITQTLGAVLRGAGVPMPSMWISIITTVFIRVPTAYLFAFISISPMYPNGDPISNYLSMLVAFIIGGSVSFIIYIRKNWIPSEIKMELLKQDNNQYNSKY